MSDLGYAYEAAATGVQHGGPKASRVLSAANVIDRFLAAVAERGDWVGLLEHMGLDNIRNATAKHHGPGNPETFLSFDELPGWGFVTNSGLEVGRYLVARLPGSSTTFEPWPDEEVTDG